MTTPTRAEMCADLARAMGWTAKSHFPDSFQPHFWIAPSGRTFEVPPDPFTSAEHNRKLVEWLATDGARWKEFKQKLLINFTLTAPLETIAEAAWRAIQSEASDDKSSQSKAHVQPCPCAWCRVDRGNAADIVRAAMEKLGVGEAK